MIRKATREDLPRVIEIYEDVHTMEEMGDLVVGWQRDVYPTRWTAEDALIREDLYVLESPEGEIVATAIINNKQVAGIYDKAEWKYDAEDGEVLVIHTLAVSPNHMRKGYAAEFLRYYEAMATIGNCKALRLDTSARNRLARRIYESYGYREAAVMQSEFNGLEGVNIVLLEKKL